MQFGWPVQGRTADNNAAEPADTQNSGRLQPLADISLLTSTGDVSPLKNANFVNHRSLYFERLLISTLYNRITYECIPCHSILTR